MKENANSKKQGDRNIQVFDRSMIGQSVGLQRLSVGLSVGSIVTDGKELFINAQLLENREQCGTDRHSRALENK
jgi:hypothetical protein